MRILHLDTGREMRGGQRQVLHLVSGLLARGVECRLLARRGSPLFAEASRQGIDVAAVSLLSVRSESGWSDLVHAHDARSHTWAALASKKPLVVSRRVVFPVQKGWFSRHKYAIPVHFLAISRAVGEQLEAAGIAKSLISIVYDGIPLPSEITPFKMRDLEAIAPFTEDPAKGSDLAREAARKAGVELQFSSNLADDLPRARLFVYLSKIEGLGSAVLLAMAHGVPVVASRVGGLIEAVEHEKTGLLVGNTPDAVAAAILKIQSDLERFGAAGRVRATERFSVDQMVEGTVRVYERLMQ